MKHSELNQQLPSIINGIIRSRLRIIGLLGAALYLMYGLWDNYLYPEHFTTFLLIRIQVSIGLLGAAALTTVRYFKDYCSLLNMGIFIVAIYGLCLMAFIADGTSSDYYVGIIMVTIAYCIANPYETGKFVVFCLISLSSYLVMVYFSPHPFNRINFREVIYFSSGTFILMGVLVALYRKQFIENQMMTFDLKRTYEVVKKHSERDSLTMLFNRRAFGEILSRKIEVARKMKIGFYLAFIDVDQFKQINDVYGHLVGDEVLIDISEKMTKINRVGTPICRYGGDEFLVILDIQNEGVARKRIENWKLSMGSFDFSHQNHHLKVSCSLGLVYVNPSDQLSAEEIISRADKEMLSKKAQIRGKR